jgi:hypothetical protein
MSTDEIYSEELEIASVHEPFRTALIGALKDRERTRKLLYSPPFSTVGFTARVAVREERHDKYGEIITYFPLRCLADYRLIEQDQFDILSLEVHARHGGEQLKVIFPPEQREDIKALMETCLNDKNKASSSTEIVGERRNR